MKNTKRILSFVLSLTLLLGTMTAAMISSNAEDEPRYSTVKLWGKTDFADLGEAELTTNIAEGGAVSIVRSPSVGGTGYGVWGYISGGSAAAIGGHTYRYVLQYDISGKWQADALEDAKYVFAVDCWISDGNNETRSTRVMKSEIEESYNSQEYQYDATYGYPYKVMTVDLTLEEGDDGNDCEFRWYTGGRFDYIAYGNFLVYDITADPDMENPIISKIVGDSTHSNDPEGYRDADELCAENDDYLLPAGYRVLKNADNENVLALGNLNASLSAGNYNANVSLVVDDVDEGDIATVKVINENGDTLATQTYTKDDATKINNANSDFFRGRISTDLPFTAAADGTYTIEIYVNGVATVTVESVSLLAEINEDELKAVEDKIKAIGEVDLSETCKQAIDDAVTAYTDLAAKYGTEVQKYLSYSVLQTAQVTYEALAARDTQMREAASTISELIDNIGEVTATDECLEAIETAEFACEDFVANYGEENLAALVENYDTLTAARTAYDALTGIALGDVNGDGKIDTSDALKALQASVGKVELDDAAKAAADVNGDGVVDTKDALLILQYSVSKITEFPVVTAG